MSPRPNSVIALLPALLLVHLTAVPAASGQDDEFEFGEEGQDDEFEFGEEEFDDGTGGSGDDEEMTFESDDSGDAKESKDSEAGGEMNFGGEEEGGLPRTVVLIIPSPGAEPELAQRFTDSLEKYISSTARFEVVESDEFRAQLFGPGQAAAMDCATNAVCLSGYGKDQWMDSIIVGVLYRGEGGWKIETNKIDVERAEVEAYASHDDARLDRRGGVELDKITRTMGTKILGLEFQDAGKEERRVNLVPMRGRLQTRLAWGTAAVAGAAISAAAIFGFQARSKESEAKADGLAQTDAPVIMEDGKDKARNANIFLGVGIAAAVGSAALFLIKPLQEVEIRQQGPTPGFDDDPEASRSPLVPEIDWVGLGAAATWRLP